MGISEPVWLHLPLADRSMLYPVYTSGGWMQALHLRVGTRTQLAWSIDTVSAHLFAKSCTGGQYPDWSKDHAQTEKGLEARNIHK